MKKYYTYNKKYKNVDFLFPLLFLLFLGGKELEGSYERILTPAACVCGLIVCSYIGFKFIKNITNRKKYIAKKYCEIDKMSGEEFELFLKAHFEEDGYFVKTTVKTNDYGVDLICKKNGRKMGVQAKRYKSKVGISAVQQIVGGVKYYNCNVGLVATNSYFTNNAWELAKRSGVILWDRNKLIEVFNIEN